MKFYDFTLLKVCIRHNVIIEYSKLKINVRTIDFI